MPHAPTPPMRWWALWETPTFKSFLYPINPTYISSPYLPYPYPTPYHPQTYLMPTSLLSIWCPISNRILSHLNAFLKSRVLKSIYKHKVPTIIYKKRALKKKSLVVCYQGILEKNGAWLNLFIVWLATPIALKIVKSVTNQPRKSMKWLDETPSNRWASLFFNNNCKKQNKPFKSCCAINVLLVHKFKIFKNKRKNLQLCFPQKIPQLRTLKLQTIAQKLLLTLDQKSDKLQDS